ANTYAITGHKALVKRMTLQELKKLDFGEGEKIPTLLELTKIAKGKIGLQIEVKAKGMAEKLVEILKQEDLIESSLISSFLHDELLEINKIEPAIKLATLEPIVTNWSKKEEYQSKIIDRAVNYKCNAIHPRYHLINQRFLDYAHKNNLKVNIWTVNIKMAMKKYIKMGVDGIITDDIPKAKEVLNG
ncbi:MAG: glycerophosphodiester phosphodiesterase, partial [Promethearchaeota archaeon]